MRHLAALIIIIITLTAAGAQAQPLADPSGALEIEGATYAEFDERTGVLTLRGLPVTIRRGVMHLRAPTIIYEAGPRLIQASGGVRYADGRAVLDAPRVTVWIDEERVLAEDGVRGTQGQGPEAVTLRAARLEVFGRDRRAVATGGVEMSTQELALTAARVEVTQARDEIVAEGDARVVRADIDGRAPRILVLRSEGTAVLSGGAVVRQGANEARAATITVDLRRRRFTAEGQAILVLHPTR